MKPAASLLVQILEQSSSVGMGGVSARQSLRAIPQERKERVDILFNALFSTLLIGMYGSAILIMAHTRGYVRLPWFEAKMHQWLGPHLEFRRESELRSTPYRDDREAMRAQIESLRAESATSRCVAGLSLPEVEERIRQLGKEMGSLRGRAHELRKGVVLDTTTGWVVCLYERGCSNIDPASTEAINHLSVSGERRTRFRINPEDGYLAIGTWYDEGGMCSYTIPPRGVVQMRDYLLVAFFSSREEAEAFSRVDPSQLPPFKWSHGYDLLDTKMLLWTPDGVQCIQKKSVEDRRLAERLLDRP